MPEREESFLRSRLTELRLARNVSEHKMSLDLGKSGSYIRSITSGTALPSMREMFHICDYLGVTPAEFFAPLDQSNSPRKQLEHAIRDLSDQDVEKVSTFVSWLRHPEEL